jgi:hypothetical protein
VPVETLANILDFTVTQTAQLVDVSPIHAEAMLGSQTVRRLAHECHEVGNGPGHQFFPELPVPCPSHVFMTNDADHLPAHEHRRVQHCPDAERL